VATGTKSFTVARAGSAAVLGALAMTAFAPAFMTCGPLRIMVYFGLVGLACATGLLSTVLSAAGTTDTRPPPARGALRFCAAVLLAGLALLVTDSLLGRPEGILAALASSSPQGPFMLLLAHRSSQ
jgi:hypothetical protein